MSKYYKSVKGYLDNFEKVKILLFEDLVETPLKTLKELFLFLGVEDTYIERIKFDSFNTSGELKNKILKLCLLLFSDNFIKRTIRKGIPYYKRIILRHYLQKNFIKKENTNFEKERIQYLYSHLQGDLKALYKLFQETEIHYNKWLQKDNYYNNLMRGW